MTEKTVKPTLKGDTGKGITYSVNIWHVVVSSFPPSPTLIPLAERRHSSLVHWRRATSLCSVRNADAVVGREHTAPEHSRVATNTARAAIFDAEKPVPVEVLELCVQDQRSWSPVVYLQKFLDHFCLLSDIQSSVANHATFCRKSTFNSTVKTENMTHK